MSELQQGLLIAAVGMGLVFAIIIFLWGLMALMMRVTSRENNEVAAKTQSEDMATGASQAMPSAAQSHRAIAAAVAVGLVINANQPTRGSSRRDEASEVLNPWQIVHRNRRIEHKRTRG
jgi:sodium pump decarboxylase gamma subunit